MFVKYSFGENRKNLKYIRLLTVDFYFPNKFVSLHVNDVFWFSVIQIEPFLYCRLKYHHK